MTEIVLKQVRISYPHLFEPFAMYPSEKAKYSAKFLIPKSNTALVDKIKAEIIELAKASFKDKKCPPQDKLCLKDGDHTGKDEDKGHWIFSASEDSRPVVVDQKVNPLTKEDDVVYPGCVVTARVRLWAQDNIWGKRINANLLGVQFVKDGERLGSGRTRQSAEEMFESVEGFDEGGDAGNDAFA
jgi:hypothetical protein